jgi:NAD-reducing hydrogenase small subunit
MGKKMTAKKRLATAWLGGCSGCHMSFLDLDEFLVELAEKVDLVYGPLVDTKEYPEKVDICLVEGAVTNEENLKLAKEIRKNTAIVVSFGDCAVTGNVTSMRNRIPVEDLLTAVYQSSRQDSEVEKNLDLPPLLDKALPLHQVIKVDIFLPGCPPDVARIAAAVSALVAGEEPDLSPEMKRFG